MPYCLTRCPGFGRRLAQSGRTGLLYALGVSTVTLAGAIAPISPHDFVS